MSESPGRAGAAGERAPLVEMPDDIESISRLYGERRWSDGLPIIPPTVERVARMMGATRRPPAEIVARVAPGFGAATIERIATAGPECFGPRPQVTSEMVSVRRREAPLTDDPHRLQAMCRRLSEAATSAWTFREPCPTAWSSPSAGTNGSGGSTSTVSRCSSKTRTGNRVRSIC